MTYTYKTQFALSEFDYADMQNSFRSLQSIFLSFKHAAGVVQCRRLLLSRNRVEDSDGNASQNSLTQRILLQKAVDEIDLGSEFNLQNCQHGRIEKCLKFFPLEREIVRSKTQKRVGNAGLTGIPMNMMLKENVLELQI